MECLVVKKVFTFSSPGADFLFVFKTAFTECFSKLSDNKIDLEGVVKISMTGPHLRPAGFLFARQARD